MTTETDEKDKHKYIKLLDCGDKEDPLHVAAQKVWALFKENK